MQSPFTVSVHLVWPCCVFLLLSQVGCFQYSCIQTDAPRDNQKKVFHVGEDTQNWRRRPGLYSRHSSELTSRTHDDIPGELLHRRTIARRDMLGRVFRTFALSFTASETLAIRSSMAAETVDLSAFQVSSAKSLPFGVSDEVVTSLVFERILGKGTYKTVYLVSGHDATGNDVKYAMAVERLRFKSDVKDAFRGIRVAEKLQTLLEHNKDKDLFERIEGWWVQSNSLPDVSVGASIYSLPEQLEGRTRNEPGNFKGTKWLVSLKPVYDMDLKSFAQKAPCLYPIGGLIDSTKLDSANEDNNDAICRIPLTESNAINLMLEVCRAGRLMHENGLVHHDVKPKNIMISQGHPVIIDFGFAQFVDLDKKEKRICAFHPGQIRGEVRYVLVEDVLKYRGCQEGDTYAMGKTMYEVIFGTAQENESSGKQPISESAAKEQNDIFRAILSGDGAGSSSRFRLSSDTRDYLFAVIVGLCRQSNPLSFAEAESFILQNITK